MDQDNLSSARPPTPDEEKAWLVQQIMSAMQGIRYGAVEIIIQDAKVVQIERREKIRFDKDGSTKRR